MKADWNDAPDYITRQPRRSRRLAKLIPGLIGTLITLAVLQMAGSAYLQGAAQRIAEKRIQPKPAPVAEISRAEQPTTRDWDKLVEDVAARGATSQPKSTPPQASTEETLSSKQTAFSDANYIPRGADNVVSFEKPAQSAELTKPAVNKEITVVGKRPSMKDRACWPHKQGSIERRNCKSGIGLSYRD
jgi:hypothetical protein